MTQFWVVHVRKPVPECLQYDGWQQDKFIYKVLIAEHRQHSDDECDVYDYIFLYGTVEDAYNFYNRIPNTIPLNIDKYKISDDGTCAICYKSHTSVYDCCDNKHFNDTNEGICLNCLKEIK